MRLETITSLPGSPRPRPGQAPCPSPCSDIPCLFSCPPAHRATARLPRCRDNAALPYTPGISGGDAVCGVQPLALPGGAFRAPGVDSHNRRFRHGKPERERGGHLHAPAHRHGPGRPPAPRLARHRRRSRCFLAPPASLLRTSCLVISLSPPPWAVRHVVGWCTALKMRYSYSAMYNGPLDQSPKVKYFTTATKVPVLKGRR